MPALGEFYRALLIGMPGIGELLIVLVIFGANKLPQIGDALGRSIKNFRRATSGNDEIEVSKRKELEKKEAHSELSDGGHHVADAEVITASKKVAK